MATIHLHQTTTSTPEQFLAALMDSGPGRSKLLTIARADELAPCLDQACEPATLAPYR